MRFASSRLFATALGVCVSACVSLAACGDETAADDDGGAGATGGSGGDDGRFHPEPNGVHISEAEACDLLREAFNTKVQDLECFPSTVRTCPNFLRVPYDPDCAEYDQGSVQGCIDFFNDIWRCELLVEDACVLTLYPETAPSMCP
jgi:hypothetical protein